MSERNKAAARTVFEVWTTGELERLDELVAPDVVHHDPYDPHAADTVATRWTGTMTHSGGRAAITGITIDRFEDGRIVEAWRSMDMLGLQRAIGAIG